MYNLIMKTKPKKLFEIIIISFLLTTLVSCSNVSNDEYSEMISKVDNLETENEKLKEENNNLQIKIDDIIPTSIHILKDIAYAVPSDWETVTDDDITYYYPESGGLLMVSITLGDSLFDMALSDVRKSFLSGIEKGSTNFESISSETKIICNDITAIDSSYYSDYNNVRYENHLIAFATNKYVYSFVIAAPQKNIENNQFNKIIESIVVKN